MLSNSKSKHGFLTVRTDKDHMVDRLTDFDCWANNYVEMFGNYTYAPREERLFSISMKLGDRGCYFLAMHFLHFLCIFSFTFHPSVIC